MLNLSLSAPTVESENPAETIGLGWRFSFQVIGAVDLWLKKADFQIFCDIVAKF